jgi:hypothetical protein
VGGGKRRMTREGLEAAVPFGGGTRHVARRREGPDAGRVVNVAETVVVGQRDRAMARGGGVRLLGH